MNKSELRKFIVKLTKEELFYQKNPTYVSKQYQQLEVEMTKDYGSVYTFSFEVELENLRRKGLPFTKQFLIVRQSRFSNVKLHKHNFIEMFIIYSGSATAVIQNKEIKLKKGNVCILDTGVPHTIAPLGEDDILINFLMHKSFFNTSMLNLLSSNDIISNFLLNVISTTKNHDHYIIFENNEMKLLFNLIENLMCEYYAPSFSTKEIIDAYMVLIFAELIKNYQRDETESYKSSNRTYIGEIIQYISENYTSCTLNSVAERFSFHPNYLSRYIKENTGHSYKELVQHQRINKASFLLLNTNLPVGEIAEEVGYKNYDFFYQKFRTYFNTTPKKYRDHHKK